MTGHPGFQRFLAFNLVGLVTTAVGIPVMVVLDLGGVPYGVYTSLNYAVGIALGFWLNFRYAFHDRDVSWRPALVRYLVTFVSLLLLVQGLQWVIIDRLNLPRWGGVGLGMLVYGGLGYVLSTSWVFGPKK